MGMRGVGHNQEEGPPSLDPLLAASYTGCSRLAKHKADMRSHRCRQCRLLRGAQVDVGLRHGGVLQQALDVCHREACACKVGEWTGRQAQRFSLQLPVSALTTH